MPVTASSLYDEADRERWVPEQPKSAQRGPFARDRARILHSSALRRLSGKTQVVGAGRDDFSRNRLTHSLEVAQVGRDLANLLGCDPDIVDSACLAHDLGHPPFGHNGELALAQVAGEIGGFEGNAQTLRLLTRLEPKVINEAGVSVGLNLTRASLDAATKYPWGIGENPSNPNKFGVYDDDRPVFDWVRQGAPGIRKCLEAQVMDLADDIAYSVHDVEDGIVRGGFVPQVLADNGIRAEIAARVRDWYLADATPDEVDAALDRLTEQPWWITEYDASRAALARLKDTTSQLIGRFILAAEAATRTQLAQAGTDPDLPMARYDADVVVPRETVLEINTLKGVASVLVMTTRERDPEYHEERELLRRLCTDILDRQTGGEQILEPVFATDWRDAADDAARLRVVVDQVASLTDSRARTWAERFSSGRVSDRR